MTDLTFSPMDIMTTFALSFVLGFVMAIPTIDEDDE